MEKVNQLHNKNNIKWKNIVDKTTKTFFLLSTLISASFIISALINLTVVVVCPNPIKGKKNNISSSFFILERKRDICFN